MFEIAWRAGQGVTISASSKRLAFLLFIAGMWIPGLGAWVVLEVGMGALSLGPVVRMAIVCVFGALWGICYGRHVEWRVVPQRSMACPQRVEGD